MPTAPAHQFLKTHSISGRTSSRNVRKLIRRMRSDGWSGPPVSVLEIAGELYVLDGQHRVVAARHARIDVHYRLILIDELAEYGYSSAEEVVKAYAEAGVNRLNLR